MVGRFRRDVGVVCDVSAAYTTGDYPAVRWEGATPSFAGVLDLE